MAEASELTRVPSIESLGDADFLVKDIEASAAPSEDLVTEFKKLELRGELKPEPLLTEDKQRFVLFPIKHTDVRKPCLVLPQLSLGLTTTPLFPVGSLFAC
jgi:hypothetical protein